MIIILLFILYYHYFYYYNCYFTIIIIIIIVSIIIIHILNILINNCQMIFLLFRIVKNITLLKIHYFIILPNLLLNLLNEPLVASRCNNHSNEKKKVLDTVRFTKNFMNLLATSNLILLLI
jgi:hypothetical protein